MSHRRAVPTSEFHQRLSIAERAVSWIVFATIVALPLTYDPRGQDTWRLPKEILFRGSAIALVVALTFILTSRHRLVISGNLRRPELLLPFAAVVWAGITAATSTNRLLSFDSLVTVACGAIFFVAALISMRSGPMLALDLALLPAVVNAILEMLQEYGIWQPFRFSPEAAGHMSSSALIGNPNDVGAYLTIPAIASAIATVSVTGGRRLVYFATALILAAGLIASSTRGCIVAYIVALACFIAIGSVRSAIGVALPLFVTAAILFSPATQTGSRMRAVITAARQHQYDIVFSERLPPFLAAMQMFRDHPVLGVGPGCFKFQFMDYRLAQLARYPAELTHGAAVNWGETHNDHLQLLAESGLPGYLLFLGAAFLIGRSAVRSDFAESPKKRIARDLAVPLVLAIFIIAMAQFPLQIAAPRVTVLYFAALCLGWRGRAQ